MPCRATCGPCCWRGYIRCSRCCARSATVKCASSPSSTMPALWGKFSSIAANHPSLRALRPLTGLRCGRWLPAAEPARNDQQWDQAAQARTGAGVRLAYRLVTRDFCPPLARHSPATGDSCVFGTDSAGLTLRQREFPDPTRVRAGILRQLYAGSAEKLALTRLPPSGILRSCAWNSYNLMFS